MSAASTPTASGPRWNATRREPGRLLGVRQLGVRLLGVRLMAFVKKRRKGVVLELTPDEVALLQTLPAQLTPIFEGGPAAIEGTDPVRDRLFPRAYLDPTEEEAEHNWQDMVHADLVKEKAAALAVLAESLERVADADRDAKLSLDREETEAWLSALNDARLAIGTTIGITEDHDPNLLDPADPEAQPFFIYDWLTMLQGTILEVMYG
jgi:hypothetical protein